jgi:hypothetical protein
MIDAGVRIIDRLIQLLQTKEKRKEKYFNNFVEPLYKDAETIIKDYNTLFIELISKIEKAEDSTEIIRWIEERRVTYLPLRTKVKALLSDENGTNAHTGKFERGIWFIMTGGLFIFEKKFIRPGDVHFPGAGRHTLLDLIDRFSAEPFKRSKDTYLYLAKAQLRFIQKAWEDVAMGYAELKRRMLS